MSEPTKRVGKTDIPATECGFTEIPDGPTCGKAAVRHGIISGTWEDISFLMACADHAAAIDRIADLTHPVEAECVDPDACWLTRHDGRSFCYRPEDYAAWQHELSRPEIAWGMKP